MLLTELLTGCLNIELYHPLFDPKPTDTLTLAILSTLLHLLLLFHITSVHHTSDH